MAEMPNGFPARPASYDKRVGLVLQGGGALGSYQAGVYEALASSEYLPDWVAGISIGAINVYGQPGFFTPRPVYDWFSPKKRVSYYAPQSSPAIAPTTV
jgi:hypothetical protein